MTAAQGSKQSGRLKRKKIDLEDKTNWSWEVSRSSIKRQGKKGWNERRRRGLEG
jgi:hypothetical protein